MKKTYASLFTGGGLADVGALAAGLKPIWGIENVEWIAAWATQQLGHPVHCLDLLECDPADFEAPYHLHASPPCPNFSIAKAGRVESELDIQLAEKVAEFIRVLNPQRFTLENVWGYRNSKSWAIVQKQLMESYGENWDYTHVNFADLGVPQTRKRMIVRASKTKLPPLPEKEEWIGWYVAIEDLIDDLPDSQFAPWQLERLKKAGIVLDETYLVSNQVSGGTLVEGTSAGNRPPTLRKDIEPSFTLAAAGGGRVHRGFIIADIPSKLVDVNNSIRNPTVLDGERPSFTIQKGHARRPSSTPVALLAPVVGEGSVGRDGGSRAPTIQANHGAEKYRAFVVGGMANGYGKSVTIRNGDAPYSSITKSHGWKQSQRAFTGTRVVAMTPRALARFQSLPDWYELPERKSQAVHIIGNGVPSLGMKKIIEGMSPL